MANQQQREKHKQNPPTGEMQIPQPDMRFAIQQRSKANSKGAGPNKNTHDQRFAMDTVVKSHCVATRENAPNEFVATQAETRGLNCC